MVAKYAAIITYDNVHSFAEAVAVKTSLGATHLVDSGLTTYATIGQITEHHQGHGKAGFATNPPAITAKTSLLATAQANALTLAGTL